jgi:transcriptional regulatory protein LevR
MNHGILTPSSATCVVRHLTPNKHYTAIDRPINPIAASENRDPP